MIRPATAPPRSALDIPVQDWDALFAAILERLTLVAGRQLATDPSLHHLLLESVDALKKLRVGLNQERALRQSVEAHARAVQAPLPLPLRQLLGLGATTMPIDISRRAGMRYPSLPNTEFP